MAESTLSLTYVELRIEVAHMLGYGRTAANWSADQITEIDFIVQTGLQQFYFPPPQREGDMAHDWSFLKPTAALAILSNVEDYDAPDDFGFMEDDMTFAGTDYVRFPVQLVGEAEIRALRQLITTVTGRPQKVAYRPKTGMTGASGQRAQFLVWPTPDAAYTGTYRYGVLAGALTAALPYPYGGMTHGRCIMQSCKAAAELHLDDEQGPHFKQFQMMLAAAISQDLKRTPEFLGQNVDRSDGRHERSQRLRTNRVSYNGVFYP